VLDPRLFSFNSRQGACDLCRGTGIRAEIDPELVVADPTRSLKGGALAALGELGLDGDGRKLLRALKAAKVPLDKPFAGLTARQRRPVLEGNGAAVEGVLPLLRRHAFYTEAEENAADDDALVADGYEAYISARACGECSGSRLNARARAVRVFGSSLPEL